jgi:hypothetical protein
VRAFDELVQEAAAADVTGWGFDWLNGRATEERPPWSFARLLADRLGQVRSALDIDTGGGEVLSEVPKLPPLMVATEEWPANAQRACKLLGPRGVQVIESTKDAPDGSFELVTARCRMELYDVGAVVWLLRKCIWWVPDFSVDRYHDKLVDLDKQMRGGSPVVAHSTRHLIEARRPVSRN